MQVGFLTRKSSKKMEYSQRTELQLEVSIRDVTIDDLDYLIKYLLSELRDMDVASAQLLQGGAAPRDSKAADLITIGSIAITDLPSLLAKIVEAVQAWTLRGNNRTVKFKGKVPVRIFSLRALQKTTIRC